MDEVYISVYTRAQALADGALVDVSQMAREAGYQYPVAVTASVWSMISAIPRSAQGIQDVNGRLWDVLWMGVCAVRRAIRAGQQGGAVVFPLYLSHGRKKMATLVVDLGPGDDAEPVFTIRLPNED